MPNHLCRLCGLEAWRLRARDGQQKGQGLLSQIDHDEQVKSEETAGCVVYFVGWNIASVRSYTSSRLSYRVCSAVSRSIAVLLARRGA